MISLGKFKSPTYLFPTGNPKSFNESLINSEFLCSYSIGVLEILIMLLPYILPKVQTVSHREDEPLQWTKF